MGGCFTCVSAPFLFSVEGRVTLAHPQGGKLRRLLPDAGGQRPPRGPRPEGEFGPPPPAPDSAVSSLLAGGSEPELPGPEDGRRLRGRRLRGRRRLRLQFDLRQLSHGIWSNDEPVSMKPK